MKKRKGPVYKTYTGQRGSPEQWRETAMRRLGLISNYDKYLKLLGFNSIPDLDALKKRWKNLMKVNHPDKGGSTQYAVELNTAFDQLKKAINSGQTSIINSAMNKPTSTASPQSQTEWINLAKPVFINAEDLSEFTNEYIAERKWNGHRYTLHIEKISKLLSQHISTVTGKYTDKAECVPHLTRVKIPKELYNTIIDAEVVHPVKDRANKVTSILGSSAENAIYKQNKDGWLKLKCFNILKYKGQDVRHLTERENKKLLKKAITELQKYIPIDYVDDVPGSQAKKLFDEVIKNDGEGIVLKRLDGIYGEDWFKAKRSETWDVIITGYKKANKGTGYAKEGLIGSIEFGIYKNEEIIPVGYCSGIKMKDRIEISNNQSAFIGRVFELKCQERTGNSFQNPDFIRWRDDKPFYQCK